MLTNLLAWSLAIASLGLYLSGFFLPELYRKFDLAASGAGLFFALTLWIYGDRVNGGLLLGTTAGVALILWFGWQTFQYRWQLTHPSDRTDTQKAKALWQRIQTLLPEGTLTQIKDRVQRLFSGAVAKDKDKGIAAAPPTAPSSEPLMDTSSDMKEDLWSESQASSTLPTNVETVSPTADAPAESTVEDSPSTAATAAPPSEPEQLAATPDPERAELADAPENTPVSTPVTDESAGLADLEVEETPASAVDLINDIPDNSDEETPTTSIENPEHLSFPTDSSSSHEGESWPPPGTSV